MSDENDTPDADADSTCINANRNTAPAAIGSFKRMPIGLPPPSCPVQKTVRGT